MNCLNCGSFVPDGAHYCPNCGAYQKPDYQKQAQNNALSDFPSVSQPSFQQTPILKQPPYTQQTPVYSPFVQRDDGDPAIAGFILGILSLVSTLVCFPILNIILGIIGLVLSIRGMKSSKRGMATAGVILSAIGLAFGVFLIVFIIIGFTVIKPDYTGVYF